MLLDKTLFETLYYDYCPRLINYGRRMLEDQKVVEDVVQEAYYRLWMKYADEDKPLPQWTSLLFSIVRNLCLDHLRKEKNVRENILRLPEDLGEVEALYVMDFNNPDRGMQNTVVGELTVEISKVEGNMSETTRRIFYMSRVERLRNKDIADRLNISVKTVEKHITIALKAFREQFESSGFLK